MKKSWLPILLMALMAVSFTACTKTQAHSVIIIAVIHKVDKTNIKKISHPQIF